MVYIYVTTIVITVDISYSSAYSRYQDYDRILTGGRNSI